MGYVQFPSWRFTPSWTLKHIFPTPKKLGGGFKHFLFLLLVDIYPPPKKNIAEKRACFLLEGERDCTHWTTTKFTPCVFPSPKFAGPKVLQGEFEDHEVISNKEGVFFSAEQFLEVSYWLVGGLGWWFEIVRVPLSNNPFHKGIP